MADGTSRQITVGPLQIPLSEASKIITLQVTPAGGASIPSRSITITGGIATTTTTSDLYVGLKIAPVTTYFPNGTTIASIIDSKTFTLADAIPTSASTTAIPARNITITGGSNVVTTTTTSDLVVGMPINNSTYYPNGATIATIINSTSFTTTVTPTVSGTATFYTGSASTKTITSGSNVVTSSLSGAAVGMLTNSTYFPTGTSVVSVNSSSFTVSNNANVPDTIDSAFLITKTATFTSGSATVTVGDTSNIAVGMLVQSTSSPSGIVIASITNSTTFVMNGNATATATTTAAFYVITGSAIAPAFASNITVGSKTVTNNGMGSTAVNSLICCSAFPLGTICNGSSTFSTSNYALASASLIPYIYTLGKTIYTTVGSKNVYTDSTVGLCVGLLLRSPLFVAGTVVASIVDSTTFTTSNNATGSGITDAFKPKNTSITINGGSNTCTITSGNTSYMSVGDVLTTAINTDPTLTSYFPVGTYITAILSSTVFTVSNNAVGKSITATLFATPSRSVSVTGLNFTTTTTSDLSVGQSFSTALSSDTLSITAINSSTTFTASPAIAFATISTTGLSVAARAVSASSGSNICTVTSTSDLCVGMVINSSNFPSNTTITAITSPTTFTTSNNAVGTYTGSVTFISDDYMMFNVLNSDSVYQVPAGKTFLALTYNNPVTASVLYGNSTDPLVPDAGGRLKSHIVPIGAVHYARNSTDYASTTQLVGYHSFPALTYPFVKTTTTAYYPTIVGVEY